MLNNLNIYFLLIALFSCSGVDTKRSNNDNEAESVQEAEVYFITPEDSSILKSPFDIIMGVKGMLVEPAGQISEGTGHHHLIINGGFIEKDKVVPADSFHIHYGTGQTKTQVELKPGKYTLTLQFANGVHQSYGQEMSTSISIEVEE